MKSPFGLCAILAVVMAACGPALAQMPMTPSYPAGAPAAKSEPAQPGKTATAQPQETAHRPVRHPEPRHYARLHHPRYRGWRGDHMANRLNRASLYGGWAAAYPYPRSGFGPAPYAANGP